jgi:hypothetical protein
MSGSDKSSAFNNNSALGGKEAMVEELRLKIPPATRMQMLQRRPEGGTGVVKVSGKQTEVITTRIVYSAATALKPQMLSGWQTYSFEVEAAHTYVAEKSSYDIRTQKIAA